MSNLLIQERNSVLVVDSRLIAQDLGIEHRALLQTLDKHLKKIEASLGAVAFEMREFKTKQGNRSTERIAWLTEDQATLLMTFSRNTERVVECKIALVEAFSKAKRIIKEVIPAQSQEIERLKLELALAQTQERLMLTTSAIATMHGTGMVALILGKPDAVVEPPPTIVEKTVLVNQSGKPIATYQGLSKTKLAQRYGMKKAADVENWLRSIGKTELLQPGMTATPCQYVPWEFIAELDRLWSMRIGSRQRLIGE